MESKASSHGSIWLIKLGFLGVTRMQVLVETSVHEGMHFQNLEQGLLHFRSPYMLSPNSSLFYWVTKVGNMHTGVCNIACRRRSWYEYNAHILTHTHNQPLTQRYPTHTNQRRKKDLSRFIVSMCTVGSIVMRPYLYTHTRARTHTHTYTHIRAHII